MNKAWFTRKAVDIDELKRRTGEEREKVPFVVEKVIELTEKEYDAFADDLLEERDFIKDNIKLMYFDHDRVWHCILVKAKDKQEGILVEAEGYDYARYSAIWREDNV
jgi:hypothetical protein